MEVVSPPQGLRFGDENHVGGNCNRVGGPLVETATPGDLVNILNEEQFSVKSPQSTGP